LVAAKVVAAVWKIKLDHMANILLAWELGGGLGHITKLRSLARILVERGHRVVAAARDVPRAGVAFSGSGVVVMAAPARLPGAADRIDPLIGYAHILHNIGFANPRELQALLGAWDAIVDYVRPDLVIVDHAPTALLALRSHHARRVTLGTGFCVPPDVYPLPALRQASAFSAFDPEQLARDEDALLEKVNSVLRARECRPLSRLGQIFGDVDEAMLATFGELDHFGPRPNARYWGVIAASEGATPNWPAGDGSRLFAYLKPFPALDALFGNLRRAGLPTLVFGDGIDAATKKRNACPTLRFADQALNLSEVAASCDLAILNAGHGTLAAMLLAGKPSLLLPLTMEQQLLSVRAVGIGAARIAPRNDPARMMNELQAVLGSSNYARQAKGFAERYAELTPQNAVLAMADRFEQLLSQR
jgi:hypothetical protein